MSSRFLRLLWAVGCFLVLAGGVAAAEEAAAPPAATNILRIVADANNLPFSNDKQEGFENKIADLIAADLGAQIEYTWRATRRGFMRESLKQGDCDITMAAPKETERALVTIPYYRSTHAFVSREDRNLDIKSFDDPRLNSLKVGVQVVGDDGVNPAPAMALGRRKIINNVVGFTVYGDYSEPNPPARIVDAVAKGDIDVACVWGPVAGFFAARQPVPMRVTPVQDADEPGIVYAFDICVGVRFSKPQLRDQINDIIRHRQPQIDAILDEYHVPHLKPQQGSEQ
jgi:mxaJ protein